VPLREMSGEERGEIERGIPLKSLVLGVHDAQYELMRHGRCGLRQNRLCLALFLMFRCGLGCVRSLALIIMSMIPPPVW